MKNWQRFIRLKSIVRNRVNRKYQNLDNNLFDLLFDISFDISFEKFERSYHPSQGTEENYLTVISQNSFYDEHQKYLKQFAVEADYINRESGEFSLNDLKSEENNEEEIIKFLIDDFCLIPDKISETMCFDIMHGLKIFRKRFYWIIKHKLSSDSIKLISKSNYLSWDILNYRIGNSNHIEPLQILRLATWIDANNRKWMIDSLGLTKMSYDKLLKARNLPKPKKEYPVLSAIILNKQQKIIANAYKGESPIWEEHCEYILFEKKLNNNFEDVIKGCLFVSLEPCSNRGGGKIPCAVRIAKSPVKTVYIGIVDTNKDILQKGIEIIRTGIYTFKKKDFVGNDNKAEGQKWLKSHFLQEMEISNEKNELVNIILRGKLRRKVKRYSVVAETAHSFSVAIGNIKIIKPFHRDIQLELLKLNAAFIENHAPGRFIILPYSSLLLK